MTSVQQTDELCFLNLRTWCRARYRNYNDTVDDIIENDGRQLAREHEDEIVDGFRRTSQQKGTVRFLREGRTCEVLGATRRKEGCMPEMENWTTTSAYRSHRASILCFENKQQQIGHTITMIVTEKKNDVRTKYCAV